MSINSIGGITGAGLGGVGGAGGIAKPTMAPTGGQPSTVGGATGPSFADRIGDALAAVDTQHGVADGLAQQAATGTLTDVHDYMIASTQAQIATELTVAVRNRALESFQTIMSMQV
jgi:flagellar hook-basal body complex protein FliE